MSDAALRQRIKEILIEQARIRVGAPKAGGAVSGGADSGGKLRKSRKGGDWASFVDTMNHPEGDNCLFGGYIYTSTNSGVNWTAFASELDWSSVASSSDGTKLVAAYIVGKIHTGYFNIGLFSSTQRDGLFRPQLPSNVHGRSWKDPPDQVGQSIHTLRGRVASSLHVREATRDQARKTLSPRVAAAALRQLPSYARVLDRVGRRSALARRPRRSPSLSIAASTNPVNYTGFTLLLPQGGSKSSSVIAEHILIV